MLYPNVNPGLMTKNVESPRLGVAPQVDLEGDLPRKLWRHPVEMADRTSRDVRSGDGVNWFVYLFRVHRDERKWPVEERVVRHLALSNSTYQRKW